MTAYPPLFLVGCPRSGTTLLQSMLASHPQIASFPETKFFQFLIPKTNWKRFLGLASRRLKGRMNRFLGEVHRQDLLELLPTSPFAYAYPSALLAILDTLAREQGKDIWLEKTPDHIYYLSYIERYLSNAKFIHIWRSGIDVVASLYEVTHKYPRAWGFAWDMDFCLEKWERAIYISMRRSKYKNHRIVCYEELVKRPESILVQLCEFIEVEFTPSMLEEYSKAAENLSMETAGRFVRSVIQQPNSEKFYRVFDEQQQRYVRDRVAQVDVTPLLNYSL